MHENFNLGPLRADWDDDDEADDEVQGVNSSNGMARAFGMATEEVFDLRDTYCSWVQSPELKESTCAGFSRFDTNGTTATTASGHTSRSGPGLQSPNASGDDSSIDCEQLLQALLLQQGLLEDHGPDEVGPGLAADGAFQPGTTLREMRRTGPLGELSQEAQTALLGGTLYEYGEQGMFAHSPGQSPPPLAAHHENSDLLRSSLDRILRLSSQQWTGGDGLSLDSSMLAGDNDSAVATLEAELRQSPDWESTLTTARSVHSFCSSTGAAAASSSLRQSALQAHLSRSNSAASGERLSTLASEFADHASPAPGHSHTHSDVLEEDAPPVIVATPSRSFGGALGYGELQAELARAASVSELDSDGDGDAVSFIGFDSPRSSRSRLSVHQGNHESETTAFDETTSIWGMGDTIQSATSTARSESRSLQQSARTVFGETLAPEGASDGLASVLHRLAFENLSLDESLSRSVRRVLQLGTVLIGQRLSDDEICALPKVRFDQAEQQNCSICLEAYQRGELLTALRCQHFFHVDCLARWFRRSSQCPLCRQDQVE